MPERFSVDTVGDGFDVVLGVIDKIDKFQQANGFNIPADKDCFERLPRPVFAVSGGLA